MPCCSHLKEHILNANSKIRWILLAGVLLLVLAVTILFASQTVRAATGVPLPTVSGTANLYKFSGTVWVEPFNRTLAIDLDRMGQLHDAPIIRDGDAYVGITSKPITIVALQNFDPVRYAPLSMANPLPQEQQTCGPTTAPM